MIDIITIETIPSKYFFSGNIILSGGQSKEIDLSKLTKTQILDILEAEITKVLLVSDIEKVNKKFQQISENSPYDDKVLSARVSLIEETLENLTVDGAPSVYWTSTDW